MLQGVPAIKEPSGLDKQDGKRPDGLTLIPWRGGRPLIWDVTVVSPLASSYVDNAAANTGEVADMSATRTRTHQEMRDSEREPFYDHIARTYFKILKNHTAYGIRTRDRKAFGRIITVHDHCASDKISSYTHTIVPNV